jgi:hypothetical protein
MLFKTIQVQILLFRKWQKYMLDGDSSWWDEFGDWMKQWEEYLTGLGGGDDEEELMQQSVTTLESATPEGVTVGVSEETVSVNFDQY